MAVPSPKVQAYVVIVPVDVFRKFMASGAGPEVVLALNWATGAPEGTVALTSFE